VTLRFASKTWLWRDGPIPLDEVRTWTLSKAEIVSMLRFEMKGVDGASPAVSLEIDKERAAAYGRELAKEIVQEPRSARFHWDSGVLTPVVFSQEKRSLDVEALVPLLGRAVTSPDERTVELPVIIEKPAVAIEDVAKMGIKELIEERSTYYGGSIPERAHNVQLGTTHASGVVVPPGGIFSFNEAIGEISESSGYQMGFSIIEGETVADPGGGICQISTTVFQTAFWAGYPVLERRPHAYRMRRYEPPPGLDATVYPPRVDLKFRNDTDTYLLVQVRYDDTRVFVAFYGTKPGWDVKLVEPVLENFKPPDRTEIVQESPALEKGRRVVVEAPEDGVDVTVGRIVSRAGREIRKDSFFSRYQPQRNVVVIGTGPEPAPTDSGTPASSAPGLAGTKPTLSAPLS
ncbi:MAG: VanW family protein, partial [Chloroflexota bacterium]